MKGRNPDSPGKYRLCLPSGRRRWVKVSEMNGSLWVAIGGSAVPVLAFDGQWAPPDDAPDDAKGAAA